MVSIKVRIKGLDEFITSNKKVIKALEDGTFNNALMKKIVRRAKYRGPRKKGKLVRGIKGKRTGKYTFKITCDVVNERGDPYPIFLEIGTRFIRVGTPERPRVIKSSSGKTAFLPFMSWAAWRTLQEAEKIFKDKILKLYK